MGGARRAGLQGQGHSGAAAVRADRSGASLWPDSDRPPGFRIARLGRTPATRSTWASIASSTSWAAMRSSRHANAYASLESARREPAGSGRGHPAVPASATSTTTPRCRRYGYWYDPKDPRVFTHLGGRKEFSDAAREATSSTRGCQAADGTVPSHLRRQAQGR